MTIWPSTLYGCILKEGYQEKPPENVIRSKMDVGPDKIRRRSSSAPRPITLTLFCSDDQLQDLETFFVQTTQHGSIQFGMFKPRYRHDNVSGQYRFMNPPMYANFNNGWRVTMQLEELP